MPLCDPQPVSSLAQESPGYDRAAWSASGRQGGGLLNGAGGNRPLHADGRSRRRDHQDRSPRNRRQFARFDGHAGLSQHLFRDQQPRRQKRHSQSENARRLRDPAPARRRGRDLRPELPPGCGRKERFRLRGTAPDKPSSRLRLDLGLRPEWPARRPARHRFDGAGIGRHRRGVFDAGPAAQDRDRLGGRRDLRHPRVWRSARGADARPRHRRGAEGRLLASGRPDPADGLDPDDDDVAQPRPRDRPGPRHRHTGAAWDQCELQRSRRQAAGLPVERRPGRGRGP